MELTLEVEGDHFQKTFIKWEKPLCGLSRSILLNKEEAYEIVQESFEEIWSMSKFHLSENDLKNYLFKIVRNKSLNLLRKRQNFLKIIDQVGNFFFPEDDVLNYDHDFDFRTLLMKLPLKQREVLYLKIKEEYSNEEIASLLGIPLGTVKSRINGGLKMLREKMERL